MEELSAEEQKKWREHDKQKKKELKKPTKMKSEQTLTYKQQRHAAITPKM